MPRVGSLITALSSGDTDRPSKVMVLFEVAMLRKSAPSMTAPFPTIL